MCKVILNFFDVRTPRVLLCVMVAVLAAPSRTRACDVCAIYTATELREEQTGPRLAIAEQFSAFTTLRQGGVEVPNPSDEYVYSSITQLIAGYNFTPTLGAQVLLPVIARPFRRITANGIQIGDSSGIGDMSVAANWLAYNHVGEESVLLFTLLGALKFPTGDPHLLGEELSEDEGGGDPHCFPGFPCNGHPAAVALGEGIGGAAHSSEAPPSGIHGHDLALGSGSVDVILGTQAFASWRRLYTRTYLQYAIRTEGAFNYQFANELVWNLGLGTYVWLEHPYTLGIQLNSLVETKGEDTVDGMNTHDTAITAIYLGPAFVFTWGTSLGAEMIFDFPTLQNNTGLQAVPTFRVRGGLTWRF